MKPHRDPIQATTLSAHCPHAVSAGVCGEAYSVIIVHQPATQRSNSSCPTLSPIIQMDDDPRILEAMPNFDAPVNIGDCVRW